MKKTVWIFMLLLPLAAIRAQDTTEISGDRPEFVISGNIGGDASLFTLGFEKLWFLKSELVLAAKLGFGYNQEFQLFSSEDPTNYFIVPQSITLNLGHGKRSYGEIGAGGSWITGGARSYYLIYPILGYRYHPFKNPGLSLRAWVFYPFGQLNTLDDTDLMIVPLGVSVGVAL